MATISVSDELLKVASPKNTLLVAQQDGRIYVADFSECPHLDDPAVIDWDISVSKLLIGKVALSRTRLATLEQVEFENIQRTEQEPLPGTGDLSLSVSASVDGKNETRTINPVISIEDGGYVRGNCRISGTNFALMLRGTYNINTVQVTLHPAGRR